MRPPLARVLALALVLLGCDAAREQSGVPLRVALDERAVLVGDVVERLDGDGYVYLRLAMISDSAQPGMPPQPGQRWVALERGRPSLGQRVRVRSLARRSRVWDAALERDFEVLDYVARLD